MSDPFLFDISTDDEDFRELIFILNNKILSKIYREISNYFIIVLNFA